MIFPQFLPESKCHLLLSVSAILLTLCSLLAISISLQTAYMWLIVVLMTTLFLTTFTFSKRPEIQEADGTFVEVTNGCQPYFIDVPPSYAHVTGLPSGNTPPPSYSKLHTFFPPPKYEYILETPDLASFRRYPKRGSLHIDFPEIFSDRFAMRHGSVSSVQTLHFNVIENY